MRKTFIYLIRVFFLSAINSVWKVVSINQNMISGRFRTIFLFLFFVTAINFQGFSQGNNCPAGQRVCKDGECHPARECGQGIPPPPGLPLDSKLPLLLIAGLGLGIYYWRSKKVI